MCGGVKKTRLLLRHRAPVVIPIGVVAPPRRERDGRAAGAEDGEGEDEEHRETGAVPGARDEVRVVLEQARAVVPEVELDEEAGDELAEDDAGLAGVVGDVAGVLDQLGHVDLVEGEALDLGEELDRGESNPCQQSLRGRKRRKRDEFFLFQGCGEDLR